MTRLLPALLAALMLAGCGHPQSYKDAQSVASALGCSGFHGYRELGASDAGRCHYRGDEITVSWFKSAAAQNSFRRLAGAAGGGDEILYGNQWAIECPSPRTCSTAKARLGGTIR